jgi:hypothetical protein
VSKSPPSMSSSTMNWTDGVSTTSAVMMTHGCQHRGVLAISVKQNIEVQENSVEGTVRTMASSSCPVLPSTQ